MRQLLMSLTLMMVAGCGGADPLGPDFIEEFSVFGGCADVILYAVDPDDELMLTFRADGVVAQARAAGGATATIFDLSTADADVLLQQGTRVSGAICNDVVENGGPRVARAWVATAGTASLIVRPEAGRETATADLVLNDVVLESTDGRRVTFERLVWTSVHVGWYAG